MSNNIIHAVMHLIKNPVIDLRASYLGKNRINNVADALERYIQDLFVNGFGLNDNERNVRIQQHFSYIGNPSNPPDMMLRGSDAIEVKKIEKEGSNLALNSSYPKAKLFVDNPILTRVCKEAENWSQKDMLYTVGVVKDEKLNALAFVYGDDYCAVHETYEAIKKSHQARSGVN